MSESEIQRLLGAYNSNETRRLEKELDAWVEKEVSEHPSGVPDFWDECDTSGRLADYLVNAGWRKVEAA